MQETPNPAAVHVDVSTAERPAQSRASWLRGGVSLTQSATADGGHDMKKMALSLFQPMTMTALVLLWALAPDSMAHNPWTLVTVNFLVMGIVLGLEFVAERHVNWRISGREFATDLFYTIFMATAIAELTKLLCDQPLGRVKHALGIATPWVAHLPFVLQVFLVLFLIEFGQYWMHKAMHYTFLWWSHAVHHHITQMNAMKGAVGNPTELFLITLSVVALFDVPISAVFCALSIGNLVGACIHSNVRYDSPRWYNFFFNTIEAHSLHHSVRYEDTRCNYAGTLIIIDRLFGTFRSGESEIVGMDDRKRLTIPQQWIYTFRPLIAAIRGRQRSSASVLT
jgi:sterol desaturase/sphingolipid hydroxylase (fatty acid hydroxylase superfamily)